MMGFSEENEKFLKYGFPIVEGSAFKHGLFMVEFRRACCGRRYNMVPTIKTLAEIELEDIRK